MNFPIIKIKQDEPAAWEAYQAMLIAQRERPRLLENPAWTQLRDEAYARWHSQFEAA